MIIRCVRKDDIDRFIEVYRKAYRGLEEYAYTRRKDIRNYFRWLYSRDSEGFMAAEVGDVIVGFVACDTNWVSAFDEKDVGEIHELFVLPEYRGRGYGSRLLLKAMDYAKERGKDYVELWVGRTNYNARRFYQKFGFRESGSWGKWVRMVREI